MKETFYRVRKLLKLYPDAQYYMIVGERSNGKTYSLMEYSLEEYVKTGNQSAYIRRWQEDIKSKRSAMIFKGLNDNGLVKKITKGEWDFVTYYSGRFYLAKYEDDKVIRSIEPFMFTFSLADWEHDKGTTESKITTIVFDEFLTRDFYLKDEFVLFSNVISTLVRARDNVKIFMIGNTVNKYCPYFSEMGLTNVKKQQPGTIDVYTLNTKDGRECKIVVEYCGHKASKKSDIYFAFDNPKLQMINNGSWEIDNYPHLPCRYKDNDVILIYFICFNDNVLQCEIINKDDMLFTYIHVKTTPLRKDSSIVFSPEYSPLPNYFRKITFNYNKKIKRIYDFFRTDKVFYQTNEVGEIVRNYLNWCIK